VTAAVPELPVERFDLACGATLLVSQRADAPVCAVSAHLRGGHSLDPPGKEGLSYLTGRLVDQGTERFDEEAFASKLETAGGSLSGSTTGVGGSIADESWPLLLDLFCEALSRPTYPRPQFERERRRLLERLAIEHADPRVQGALRFRRLVYGDHFLGRSDHGQPESVMALKPADLRRQHALHWRGSRAVLAFSGSAEPAAIARHLERRLRGWDAGKPLGPPSQEFPARKPRVDVFHARRQQVHLYFGHLGVRRTHPDYAALVVMDHVLGTGPGFTNRIARILRDELGLAYTVIAAIHSSAGVFPGAFSAYIGTSPEHVETALGSFVGQIERIREELADAAELDLAKSYLTGSFAIGFERASRRVNAMISAYRNELPEDHLAELLHAIEAVTAEDVRRVAAAHLHPREACVVAAGPIKKQELRAIVRAHASAPA